MTTKIPTANHRIRPHRTVMPAARPDLAGQWRAPGSVGSWEAGPDCASANDYPRIVTSHYRRFRGSSELPSRSLPGKVPNLGCRLAEEEPHTTISRAPCMSTQRMAPKGTRVSGRSHQLLHGELVDPNQNYLLDDHRDPHLDEDVQVHLVVPQVVDQEPVGLDRDHHEDDVRETLLEVA
jgi:hypothetical protein